MGRVVCGWYTPDYKRYADALRANLNQIGELHDFVEVAKDSGIWEVNTLRKPAQILAAMERWPERTIIFLDVDCHVSGELGDLASIGGDVGLHFRARTLRDGTPRLNARSGTMVIRPTRAARLLIEAWARLCVDAPFGAVDQRTLPMAIALTPGLTITVLGNEYCSVHGDGIADPVISHDCASQYTRKVPRWRRVFSHIIHRVLPRRPEPTLDGLAAEIDAEIAASSDRMLAVMLRRPAK